MDVLAAVVADDRDRALVLSEARELLDDVGGRFPEVEFIVDGASPPVVFGGGIRQWLPQACAVAHLGRWRSNHVEQRRGHVDVLGERLDDPTRIVDESRSADYQRDPVALVEVTELLDQPVVTQLFTVIRGQDDHRVLGQIQLVESSEKASELGVDLGNHPVVGGAS